VIIPADSIARTEVGKWRLHDRKPTFGDRKFQVYVGSKPTCIFTRLMTFLEAG
jgi:hypothetical protein